MGTPRHYTASTLHHTRIRRLAKFAAVLALWMLVASALPTRLVVVNLSSSVAPGLYAASGGHPSKARLIEFPIPQAFLERFPDSPIRTRRYALVLKPVAAGPGDHVDTTGSNLRINGTPLAAIQTHDSQGRPLPVWRADRMLETDEFFVFSPRAWNSLDSRYFGPIRRQDIVSVRTPLLTWGGP